MGGQHNGDFQNMKTIGIGPFLGINNRLPDFALHGNDGGHFVRAAENVDIDNAGRLRRRRGYDLIQAMSGAHSIYDDGANVFLVRGATLYKMTSATPYAETLVKLLSSDSRVSCAPYNGDIYYSNGTDSGRIAASGAWYPWALPSPAQPTVTSIAGTLPAGRYQVALTYYNNVTGEEGGCAGSTAHELTTDGALRVAIPGATTGATHVRVYCSTLNGGVETLQTTVAVGTSSVDLTSLVVNGAQCSAMYQEPMPACTRIFTHMGRLCGVVGSQLIYSEPYRFGYYRPSQNYIPFAEAISTAISAQFGVYVAADKTYWIPGDINAPEGVIADVLPYGAVPGTEFSFPHNSMVGWFGDKGVVFADTQGQAEAVMSDNIDLSPPGTGHSIVLSSNGFRRVVSCGWCVNLENKAATQYTWGIASASGRYGTRADGIYSMDGEDDAGEPIESLVGLGRQDFGAEEIKRLPAVYVGAICEQPLQLRVVCDGPGGMMDYGYSARTSSDSLRNHRIDPGKGLVANWFDLSLSNITGADFSIASIAFAPIASTRRI